MERKQILLLVLLGVSVALFIAGIVMIAVGAHKANSNKNNNNGNCPNPAQPSLTPVVDFSHISSVFTSSQHKDLQWSNDLTNPGTQAYKAAAANVSDVISKALSSMTFSMAISLIASPSRVKINKFTNDLTGGVDAYSTLLFSNDVDDATVTAIANALTKAGYQTNAYSSSLSQCNGQPFGPPNSNPATVSPAPTTILPPTLPSGGYCDASSNSEAVVFLVDLAVPAYGDYDAKLSSIRGFLSQMDTIVSLNQTTSWNTVQYFLVVYYGYDAYTINSQGCMDHNCWTAAISSLNTTLNANANGAHNLALGLTYVSESLGKQLPSNLGKTIFVLSDGLDYRTANDIPNAAQILKKDGYSINALSSGGTDHANSYLQSMVTDSSHFYSIPDWSWLSNQAILTSSSQWICAANTQTVPPTTLPPTPVPLVTTASPTTVTTANLPTTTTPSANCPLDVIYVIDESQTMLDNFFQASLQFVSKLSHQLSALQPAARFGLVTFNSKLIFSSNGYLAADDLDNVFSNISLVTGVTDFAVGFSEARRITKTYGSNSTNVLPLIVFLTDGDQANNTVSNVIPITTDLRQNYKTEIIGLGLNPTTFAASLIKSAIGFGSADSYTASKYSLINNVQELSDQGPTTVIKNIDCSASPSTGGCFTDITFVIETSYAMHGHIAIEQNIVANTIQNFRSNFGPFSGRISIVYFSAPQATGTSGGSGILLETDNAANAISTILNENFKLGGASDIKTGMELASKVVDDNTFGNDQLVLFFTRGIFVDGNSTNCCDDPAAAAAVLRKKAAVQGIVIGYPPDKGELDSLTGTTSLDANVFIKDPSDTIGSAKNVSDALTSIITKHIANAQCKGIPDYVSPCLEAVDVTIALHGSTPQAFKTIQSFVAQTLLPSFFGGSLSNAMLTRDSPINIAMMTANSTTTNVLTDFSTFNSPLGYSQLISSAPPTNSYAPMLSKAYNTTQYLRRNGRPYASTIVIVITDAFSPFDTISAENALNALQPAYAEGIQIGTPQSAMVVSGTPIIISSVDQLNPNYPRSAITFANKLAKGMCRVVTTPAPVTQPITTPQTTPSPPPRVKPRTVWPDITILVDTSLNGTSAMTDRGFQQLREFIWVNFLNNLWISDMSTRISLATFDANLTIACTFKDMHNYYDFKNCISNNFIYNVVYPHTSTRDLNSALATLQQTVYNTTYSGYEPLKENFLIIMTTGSASADATVALQNIQRSGVRTVGINLGGNMPVVELSAYGADSVKVNNWMDEVSGINSNMLGQHLVDHLTSHHAQPLSNFYADFYFIVDASYAMDGKFQDVKTFINNFVNQFVLDDHRARVAMVPYSTDLLSNILPLTDSSQVFGKYLAGLQYVKPSTQDANIGSAILQTMKMINATLPLSKATYVIYIVESPTAIGTQHGADLVDMGVTTLTLQTNNNIQYSNQLVTSKRHIFPVGSTQSLNNWIYTPKPQNAVALFFNFLTALQEDYRQSTALPLSQLSADIAFAVDLTGLTNQTFTNIKNYLIQFTQQFHVGRSGAQFALQAFNGRMVIDGGFHFSDCANDDDLVNRINNLQYKTSNKDATHSDLITALVQINEYFMTPAKGWRNGPTYVIMLTSGELFYEDALTVNRAKNILTRAKTSAISLNGHAYPFVNQFVNDEYDLVFDPTQLTVASPASTKLADHMSQWYDALVFPLPPPLPDVNADFVFLIDNNNKLGSTMFAQVKTFLKNFMRMTTNTFGDKCRMGVINYNYLGAYAESSFGLTAFKTQDQISNAIDSLPYKISYLDGNVGSAVNYFFHNDTFGYTQQRPTFVIDIAASWGSYGSPIPERRTWDLNIETFTFAYVFNSSMPFNYLEGFLGADGFGTNYVGNAQFTTVDTTIKQYIIDGYQSWMGTYGN